MSDHDKALDFIKKLLEKYSAGGYVFRGVNEEYSKKKSDGINSTLYRNVMEEEGGKALKETLEKIGIPFFPAFIEKGMVDEARRYFPSSANNLEILTDLQHFGGATNMIDFSRSIYVALFFACQGSTEDHGEFIALSLEEAKEINEVDYKKLSGEEALEVIAPAHSESSKYRVNFQGSIFVRPAKGYISRGKCEVKTVCKDLKKHILQCIKNTGGITSKNIYNDFHGVITTQKGFLKRNIFSYLAQAHYFSGNLKESISSSNISISLNPDESYTDYNERGIAYNDSRQYQKAIKDFNKAISLNYEFAEAYNNRGYAYGSIEQYQLAIQDFDKAISLNPNLVVTYNNRGNAYNKLAQYDRAIQDLDKAISLKPNLAEAYSNRGNAYNGLEQYQRAIQDFDKAISLNPDIAIAYCNRGNTYNKLAQYDRAIKDFDKAIKIDSEIAETYNSRAFTFIKLKKYERVIEDFDKAISINPHFSLAYFNRALFYSYLKQYQRAIEDFDKAIEINPNFANAYYYRGLVKRRTGDEEGAQKDFDKAAELGFVPPEKNNRPSTTPAQL